MKIDLRFQSSRRDKFKIVADILALAKNGSSKTKIMYKANLSHAQLKNYLDLLLSRKLIVHFSESRRYVTSSKGLMYMQAFSHFEVITKSLTSEMGVLDSLISVNTEERIRETLAPHLKSE